MKKVNYNFINPNTKDDMVEFLPKIIAKSISNIITNKGISSFLKDGQELLEPASKYGQVLL